MKVMIAPVGSRGDVQPLLGLGVRLEAAGHDVLVCAAENFEGLVRGVGLAYTSGGRDVQAAVEAEGEGVFNPMGFIRVARSVLREQHALILEAGRRFGPDVLLVTPLLLAGPNVSELLGCRLVWTSMFPSVFPSARYAYPLFGWRGRWPWVNRLSWVVGERMTRALFSEVDTLRVEHGLAPVTDLYGFLSAAGPMLLAFPEHVMPLPSDWPKQAQATGFWYLDEDAPLPAEVEAFLDAGPPPVYVGFGSMPVADREARTRAIVAAIEASGRRGLLSAGWGDLGGGALPPSILRLPAVSHRRLFPRVAAVAHHCGAGTTAAALRAGVPQVPVPHGFDQPLWADRITALGVATPPLPRSFKPQALGAALRHAAEDPTLRAAAQAAAVEIGRQDGCGEAVRLLEALVGSPPHTGR